MGKASMCIRMLQLLNTGRTYKISELANLLDTNPRNIIEYKKELDEVASECGYDFYIETIPGRYGGYRLNGNAVVPSLSLSNEEKISLLNGLDYLMGRNDFSNKKEFQIAFSKITSSLILDDIRKEEDNAVINRFPLAMTDADIKYRYEVIKLAIRKRQRILFSYLSSKNLTKEHRFDPYEVFMYNNAWFVIGWLNSTKHSSVCWFKLNRISEIKMIDEKFTHNKNFDIKEYIDEYGFKNNSEWYHIEFIAHGAYASSVKERIYGKNQVIEVIDDNSTKVSVDMQNKENIRLLILGFGKNVDVLEPQWLKDDLKDIGKALFYKY